MDERDDSTTLSHAVGELLEQQGWYYNGGWRRKEDARVATTMPPTLSMGEAVDETVARERRRLNDDN